MDFHSGWILNDIYPNHSLYFFEIVLSGNSVSLFSETAESAKSKQEIKILSKQVGYNLDSSVWSFVGTWNCGFSCINFHSDTWFSTSVSQDFQNLNLILCETVAVLERRDAERYQWILICRVIKRWRKSVLKDFSFSSYSSNPIDLKKSLNEILISFHLQ